MSRRELRRLRRSKPDPVGVEYPSVGLAYDTVQPSYDLAIERVESAHKTIDGLIKLSLGILGAVATLGIANHVADPHSGWLYAGFAAFVLTILVAFYARAFGEVVVVAPTVLYASWLTLDANTYRRYAIYWAGEHLLRNRQLIYRKWLAIQFVTGLLLLEGAFLVIWLIAGETAAQPTKISVDGTIPVAITVTDGIPIEGTVVAVGTVTTTGTVTIERHQR